MKASIFLLLILLPLAALSSAAFKDQSATDSSAANAPPPNGEKPENIANILDTSKLSFQLELTLIVVIFGMITVIVEAYLAAKHIIQSEHIFKCIILTLIITGSLLLITAGYSNNQINGITGLLGSIAGYLLAKTNFKRKPIEDKDNKGDGI